MTRSLNDQLFSASFPFSFELLDEQEESAIYIVPEDIIHKQRIRIRITNTAGRPLYLAPVATDLAPGPDNHHFELRFRTGALSKTSLGKARPFFVEKSSQDQELARLGMLPTRTEAQKPFEAGKWLMSPAQAHAAGEWISFFLARTSIGGPWEFQAGDAIVLTLHSLSAEPSIGARETRVELLPGPNTLYCFGDEKIWLDPKTIVPKPDGFQSLYRRVPIWITEPREHTLRIINHLGEPVIPLHLGWVGPNMVLNDGQTNKGHQLELRITNTSPKRTIHFQENSRIYLQFDSTPNNQQNDQTPKPVEGDIGFSDAVEKIRLFLERTRKQWLGQKEEEREENQIPGDFKGQSGQEFFWTVEYPLLSAVRNGKAALEPKETLTLLIDLNDFLTDHPAGITFFRLHYENVPGYWDGELACPIEISPLRFRVLPGNTTVEADSGARSLSFPSAQALGIGTVKPEADSQLHVYSAKQNAVQLSSTHRKGAALTLESLAEGGGKWLLVSSGKESAGGPGNFLIHQPGKGSRFGIDSQGKVWIGPVQTRTAQLTLETESTDQVIHAASPSEQGAKLTLENKSTGGRKWHFISTGSKNDQGAGKFLIQSDKGKVVISEAGDLSPDGGLRLRQTQSIHIDGQLPIQTFLLSWDLIGANKHSVKQELPLSTDEWVMLYTVKSISSHPYELKVDSITMGRAKNRNWIMMGTFQGPIHLGEEGKLRVTVTLTFFNKALAKNNRIINGEIQIADLT